jgi:hypothetical protein
LTWSDNGVYWPKDLLATDVPKARIFSFGYRADIVGFWGGPSQNRIDNHADDLVAQLAGIRTQTKTADRPIILVAHSLGGLVCEQAILSHHNRQEEDMRNIALNIKRIAYLGTPHEGSDKAKWGEAGRRFLDIIHIETNETLLKNLIEGSEKLSYLQREFLQLLRRRAKTEHEIEIMCFFEGKKSKLAKMSMGYVVPEKSACIAGYPSISLHADHVTMSRFDDKDDENYQRVVRVLQSWVEALQKPFQQPGGHQNIAHTSFNAPIIGGFGVGQMNGGNPTTGGQYTFHGLPFMNPTDPGAKR